MFGTRLLWLEKLKLQRKKMYLTDNIFGWIMFLHVCIFFLILCILVYFLVYIPLYMYLFLNFLPSLSDSKLFHFLPFLLPKLLFCKLLCFKNSFQLPVHWWAPETYTGHYMPAKISKISISPLLGCYYWLTELIHVSGYLTITNAHTVNVLSSNIVKNSCLQQTTWCVRQPTVVDQQSHLWADWPPTTWWTVGDFCWLYITIIVFQCYLKIFVFNQPLCGTENV